jgi:hypothetical protein
MNQNRIKNISFDSRLMQIIWLNIARKSIFQNLINEIYQFISWKLRERGGICNICNVSVNKNYRFGTIIAQIRSLHYYWTLRVHHALYPYVNYTV